jgi:hypothetical protein
MINHRANSIFGIASTWHAAAGVLRPSVTIVWKPSRDRVSQEQRVEPRKVSIPRQSRGLKDMSRLKRLGGPLTRPGSLFRSEHDHRANFGAIDRTIAGAKAADIPVAWASIPDPRNSAISSRDGVRVLLATSDVDLLAGGAWRALAPNREAIGDEAPQASISAPGDR